MPRKGWTKPPGYQGYVRKKPTGRGPARRPTAGPQMLSISRVDRVEPPSAILAADTGNAVAGASGLSSIDNDDSEGEEEAGLISSRTRKKKRSYLEASQDNNVSEDNDGDSETHDSVQDSDSNASDEEEEVQAVKKKRNTTGRRGVLVLSEDEDDDSSPPPPPAGDTLNVLEFSVTLSKHQEHVQPAWLQLVHNWMQERCVAGAASLERGGKRQLLHVQMMVRIKIDPRDADKLKDEIKSLVGWRRGDGSGTYCQVKEFKPGQVSHTLVEP